MELLFKVIGEAGFKLVIEEGKTRQENEDKDEPIGSQKSSSDWNIIWKIHIAQRGEVAGGDFFTYQEKEVYLFRLIMHQFPVRGKGGGKLLEKKQLSLQKFWGDYHLIAVCANAISV